MKHKLGPLPVWAWALIAGGTLGIFLYMRRAPAATIPVDTATGLAQTAGAPPDTSTGGGGNSGLVTTAPPLPDTAPAGASLDDIYGALLGLNGEIAALPGGQGLTDTTSSGSDTPTQTFAGEVADVTNGAKSIAALAALFAPAATSKTASAKKQTSQKKANQGSGGTGKTKETANATARRTRKHVAAPKSSAKRSGHTAEPAAPNHVHSGGNGQAHRTEPHHAKPKPKPKH